MTRPFVEGFTVDSAGALDLDDAIWSSEDQDGFVVHVSIADASRLVLQGSASDSCAFQRVATRYFHDLDSHMLPENVAVHDGSLLPGEARPTLSISIPLTREVECVGNPCLKLTQLKSREKFTYSRVNKILQRSGGHELYEQLRVAVHVAKRLRERRGKGMTSHEVGALGLVDLVAEFVTTEEGVPRKVGLEESTGRLIVSEYMVLANRTVAEFCLKHRIPILYRNHDANGEGTDALRKLLSKARSPAKRIAILERYLGRVEVERAMYAPFPSGHFGLGVECYTHATSPLRRYADLVSHRQIKAFLTRRPYPYSQEDLVRIAAHINAHAEQLGDEKELMHRKRH